MQVKCYFEVADLTINICIFSKFELLYSKKLSIDLSQNRCYCRFLILRPNRDNMSNSDQRFGPFRGHISQINPKDQLRIVTLLSECGKDTVRTRLKEIGFDSCFDFYPFESGIYIYYKTSVRNYVIRIREPYS